MFSRPEPANPIMVQGAAFDDLPMSSGFAIDITRAVPDGALIETDPVGEPPSLHLIAED